MISQQPQGAVLRLGKVVKVHPSDHSIDLVMLDNGAKMANVQLLAPTASTRSGRVDLPEPELPDPENPWSLKMSEKQDLLAAIAMMGGTPICIGFLYPQVNELAMPEDTKNLAIERHASDFYTVTTDTAVKTFCHPGGSYLSMGGAYANLNKKDFDQQWEIKRNLNEITTTIYNPTAPSNTKRSSGTISCNSSTITLKSEGGKGGASIVLNIEGFIIAKAADSILATADHQISLKANQQDILLNAGHSVNIKAGSDITAKAPVIFLN